jgi:pre-mRNA-splicing helicase BRR2
LAVYTQQTYSFDSHSKTSEIRVVNISSGYTSLITEDPKASNPKWLGDGNQLVWLRERDDGQTEFVVDNADEPGREYTAGSVAGPVSDLKVTSLGRGEVALAVSGKADPDGALHNPKEAEKPRSSGKIYTSLFVRHWDTYVEPQKNSIFYGTLKRSSYSDRYSLSRLSNLLHSFGVGYLECPIPPFGGSGDFDINRRAIVFISKAPGLNPATHTKCTCYYCPIPSWTEAFTAEPKAVVASDLHGALASPVLSSDGTKLAYLSMREDGYESDKNRIVIASNLDESGETFEVFKTEDGVGGWDLSPQSLTWSHDDSSLLIQAEDTGRGILFQLAVENYRTASTQQLTRLTSSGYVTNVAHAAADSSNLFVTSSSLVENNVFSIIDPFAIKDTTIVSSSSRRGTPLGLSPSQVDEIWWRGALDHPVHAWVVKPSRFNPAEKYPLCYLIHGGPQGAWNDQWSTRWNPAVFAEQGYVVIAPNPTGSTGYGQEFTDAIRDSWGGRPYEDIYKGFEYIERHLEYVDTDRAVALGASYGGYMMNWIQGHSLGRKFKALVTHDGVFSMTSQLASDEQYFPIHDLRGPIWKVPENWTIWDPSRFTHNWETPHLIIHNELDYRLTIAEGLAAFNVLQLRGVDSAFLTFPDENHWVLKHENGLVWHRTVLNWINKYAGLPPVLDKDGSDGFPPKSDVQSLQKGTESLTLG